MISDRLVEEPSRRWLNWLTIAIILMAIFNVMPFLAPVFMKLGWQSAGNAIYLVYGFLCHQMAQRSFFLFGARGFQMYAIAQLPVKASGPYAALALRQFDGNAALGWKVAWSDRMVYMYGSPLLAAIMYAITRRFGAVRPLRLWMFGLLLLPMGLDGFSHMISDFAGIGQGFRDTNAWLAILTNHALPVWFYQGDALGSFNSWMRLISGVGFGFAVVWLTFPYIDQSGAPVKEGLV